MSKVLGQLIQDLRKEKNITQEAVAAAINTSRQRYSRMENDQLDITYKDLCRIAKALQVEPNTITNQLKQDDGLIARFREVSNQQAAESAMSKIEEILRVFFAHRRIWERMHRN